MKRTQKRWHWFPQTVKVCFFSWGCLAYNKHSENEVFQKFPVVQSLPVYSQRGLHNSAVDLQTHDAKVVSLNPVWTMCRVAFTLACSSHPLCINGYRLRLKRYPPPPVTGSSCRGLVTLSQRHYILHNLAQSLVKRRWPPLDALKRVPISLPLPLHLTWAKVSTWLVDCIRNSQHYVYQWPFCRRFCSLKIRFSVTWYLP